ncbi:hypothetical protein [Silvibacterium dinghuense]|uniref:Uncharacterized protein n=1 Tax=Silvibacterium dinghuense TaxID=1560006 RepID=A0A4Q1SIJ8_9BACT|nr:hypothetical protein [Silvibacterium dinghuense]RXS97426.1 hypothetical protein ESZ00_05885 [Silvibacterium dinghuense]GGG98916.1 hypothetical protein GCM10011586_13000 [Silvibacterium dinghuense]
MKRFAVAAFVVVAGLFASSLHAQNTEVRFTVPFNFIVSGKTLPAGTYRIYAHPDSVLIIENVNRPVGALSYISFEGAPSTPQEALVFHKCGDLYFLHEIDSSTTIVNGELPTSKAEKQAGRMVASAAPQNVTIALKK